MIKIFDQINDCLNATDYRELCNSPSVGVLNQEPPTLLFGEVLPPNTYVDPFAAEVARFWSSRLGRDIWSWHFVLMYEQEYSDGIFISQSHCSLMLKPLWAKPMRNSLGGWPINLTCWRILKSDLVWPSTYACRHTRIRFAELASETPVLCVFTEQPIIFVTVLVSERCQILISISPEALLRGLISGSNIGASQSWAQKTSYDNYLALRISIFASIALAIAVVVIRDKW